MSKTIPTTLEGAALYRSERKIYPREVSGRLQRLRTAAVFWLLGMYYLFPWLMWDGRQAVLFDLPARKFYVFGLAFWPQDFIFLALLLIMAGLALFFFTALAGRLWCGYACPQTVWTEVFLWMERWTEGDRGQRIKLDRAPWSFDKVRRKGSKHALWVLFALWTGFTFVGFFTPIRDLGARLLPFEWGGWETFWVLFYALATWGNAGFLREQVCKYMCPYARFQGAMFDRNTLIISYDPMRGEPRGARKRGALASVLERARGLLPLAEATRELIRAAHRKPTGDPLLAAHATTSLVVDRPLEPTEVALPAPLSQGGDPSPAPPATGGGSGDTPASGASRSLQSPDASALGDCIDCTICVQVCPTGIDIRNGLQYECIACGACVDACDTVMDRMGYPRGLIRYTTQNAVDGRPARVLRPRVLIYGTLLLALFAGWLWGIGHRAPLIAEVLRDRNALYRLAADGTVENAYTLKLVNKTAQPQTYRVTLEGDAALRLVGTPVEVAAGAEEVIARPLTLRAPAGALRGGNPIVLRVERVDDPAVNARVRSRFFAPP